MVKEQQIYANIQTIEEAVVEPVAHDEPIIQPAETNAVQQSTVEPEHEQHIDPIYQNQGDLSECIDDTGIRAIALYDYQAAADDEISFDPDDLITHIEQVNYYHLFF